MCDALYEQAAEALRKADNAIAVTGAGISVESGIPDFRSADGIWARYNPAEYATHDAFMADPDKVWEMWYDLAGDLENAEPNPAHLALAELEVKGYLKAVITQNIDGLHHDAGSKTVVEYHGNTRTLVCLTCHQRKAMSMSHRASGAPRCDCGGYLKPDVVLFGELIPKHALLMSESLTQSCGVLIVVGTSATVYPAASLPFAAKDRGAFIIECNLEATDFTHGVTDVFLQGPAAETLPQLVRRVTPTSSR